MTTLHCLSWNRKRWGHHSRLGEHHNQWQGGNDKYIYCMQMTAQICLIKRIIAHWAVIKPELPFSCEILFKCSHMTENVSVSILYSGKGFINLCGL